MAKFKANDLVTGIMWGVVAHAVINVVLPQMKTLNLSQLFNFNVAAQPEAPTTPTEPTEPTEGEEPVEGEEEPVEGEEEEPMDGEEEEEEAMDGEGEEEEYAEGEGEEEEEETAGVAYGSGYGGGRSGRRSRGGLGEDDITAEYAMRVRV